MTKDTYETRNILVEMNDAIADIFTKHNLSSKERMLLISKFIVLLADSQREFIESEIADTTT